MAKMLRSKMRGVVHTATVVSKWQSKATDGGDEVWGGDTDIGYMNALVDSCAKVKDPLSNASLDLTRQCVNISLSRDGLKEVRSPSPLCPGCPVRTPKHD